MIQKYTRPAYGAYLSKQMPAIIARPMSRALMIQGTSSWAGKSLLTTALARLLARDGRDIAPFKGVNMSNNARVVRGGEIGVAQYLQALAAGVEPEVRMNPVLVKPDSETSSQVVVLGKANAELSATPWRDRAPLLRAAVDESLDALLDEHDFLIAEGAGSPAEVNLQDIDLANMHVARRSDAAVLLVVDIDRGGAFAHLYGTWALLPAEDRARIEGFILNRFRGDAALLDPAPAEIERLTGVPVLGVVPMLTHSLPDEDGAASPIKQSDDAPKVAVVRYPFASNLDEFKPIERVAALTWASSPDELIDADLVILPGSKSIGRDLQWLRNNRFDRALAVRIASEGRVLAICGGLQMLGGLIKDSAGLEGGDVDGIGFLPLVTELAPAKQTETAEVSFEPLAAPWSALSGLSAVGYEIRHGRTEAAAELPVAIDQARGWASGSLLAVYLHGLFENEAFTTALLGAGDSGGIDAAIDQLAGAVAPHLDMRAIAELLAP